ncbi:MAG: DUF429 domain-containing protein [Betaproteobacteria bacterium]
MRIIGVDFTSAPGPRKAITVARCELKGTSLRLLAIDELRDFDAFEALLREPGPWVGGFDFPFGLPRELLRDLGWPRDWRKLVAFCAALSRREWRGILDGYRATRPAGRKYAHRATDLPAGSSSPMKLVNPPVALMFHEGAPRLAEAGVHVPGLAEGDRRRIALEAYPGLLARSVVGRESYKNDSPSKQTRARQAACARIVAALTLVMPAKLRRRLTDDGSGDALDSVLCAVQAAGAARKRSFGLPDRVPRGEGWIISS